MRLLWILSIGSGAVGLLLALLGIFAILLNLGSSYGRGLEDTLNGEGFTIIWTALATVPYSLLGSIVKIRALGSATPDERDTERM